MWALYVSETLEGEMEEAYELCPLCKRTNEAAIQLEQWEEALGHLEHQYFMAIVLGNAPLLELSRANKLEATRRIAALRGGSHSNPSGPGVKRRESVPVRFSAVTIAGAYGGERCLSPRS